MQPLYFLYVLALFVTAAVGIILADYAERRWKMLAARPFSFMMGCVGWWGLFAGLSAVAPSQETAVWLGVPFRFSGVILVVPMAVLFALAYCGHHEWLRPRRLALILTIPVITLLLNWTAVYHQLFVYDVVYEKVGDIWLRTAWSQGVWFQYVYTPYNVFLTLLFLFLLLNQARQSQYPYREQAYLIFGGALVPSLAGIPATFNWLPGPNLDFIVLSFLVMGLSFGWALSRFQLLDIIPIALRTIIENITDALLVVDNENRVVELNPALCKRLGMTRQQAVGLKLEEIFAAWPEQITRYNQVSEGRIVIAVPADNGVNHFDVQISPVQKDGRKAGRLIIWRDISRLKETERALSVSLQRMVMLYQIAESLSDFTRLEDLFQIIVERVAKILPADRVSFIVFEEGTEEMAHFVAGGQGSDKVLGVSYGELMEGLTGWVLRESKPALSSKNEPDLRESEAVRQRRLETDCGSVMVSPVLYRGRVVGTITAINRPEERDFTWQDVELLQAVSSHAAVAIENTRLYRAQKEQVQELKEANEALEAFSHMVAHDLKGPVSIIFGYTELMMMEGDEKEVSREDMVRYAGILLETGHKMASIINELLMLAKVRRQDDLPLEELDTNSILNEVLFRLNWQVEEVQARITMPQSWPAAVGYAPWIEEVWVNYIQNAIKYAGDKPEIVLGFDESGSQADGHVRFWVKDSGPGIAAEEQKHLFMEFSRVGERKIQGHGLGLAVVRRIMERMGGRFGVESEVGEGSLFYFTLPAAGSGQ